ncbi:GPP34 family phosphoprotein [Saccharopolyspora mangrovi]|uniref:GPP34 family phosphoprotein n=1 Tax=Saccharopolyspora mangrovi TaxID=3082379 RepID=A0ABU6AER0_9PSEU|nr:GPP34 family phosphoprotein [Saccharopolyspora sp. S2-29]MEB3369931.1 GPP34 family phosphoprotein [Saccharopolyspora sp. S2-29]
MKESDDVLKGEAAHGRTAPELDNTRLPLRIADRFFLAAHSGENRISPRIDPERLALGCAGGLLAELIVEEEIAVTPDVRPSGNGRCPDFLSWTVLREIRREAGHDLRTWLEHLSRTAVEKVRCRLVLVDVLREVPISGGLRGGSAAAWRVADSQCGRTTAALEELFTGTDTTTGNGVITVPERLTEVTFALLVRETGALRPMRFAKQAQRQGEFRMNSWESLLPGTLRTLIHEIAGARGSSAITPVH